MKTILTFLGTGRILVLLVCAALSGLAFFLKYCIPGYSFSALVCICLIGILLFYTFMPLVGLQFPVLAKYTTRIFTAVLILGLLIVGATEAVIIHKSFGDPNEHVDYVVVLGAKVNADGPSVSLMDRICAAYDYAADHPDTILILSGGQGTDEPITEAECMFRELTAMGIDPSRVWLEPNATSTLENLDYSLKLIEEKTGTRPATVGILSSEFHLLRAGMFAEEYGIRYYTVPAKTSDFPSFLYWFAREIVMVWYYSIF